MLLVYIYMYVCQDSTRKLGLFNVRPDFSGIAGNRIEAELSSSNGTCSWWFRLSSDDGSWIHLFLQLRSIQLWGIWKDLREHLLFGQDLQNQKRLRMTQPTRLDISSVRRIFSAEVWAKTPDLFIRFLGAWHGHWHFRYLAVALHDYIAIYEIVAVTSPLPKGPKCNSYFVSPFIL